MDNRAETVKKYWDQFYVAENLGIEDIPSQFAAFVLAEFMGRKKIIDVGCGNGRDSFFFSRYVDSVVGLDASNSALTLCNKKKKHNSIENVEFFKVDLSSWESCEGFLENPSIGLRGAVVYARFLLHAVDEYTENNFIKFARIACQYGSAVAVEFRTHRDEQQKKETKRHFRRYINPLEFMQKVRAVDLSLSYFAEGFGFAKYKSDDAHVARFIFNAPSESKG